MPPTFRIDQYHKKCCVPTSSGSDIDPGNRAAIKALRAQLREAQEELRTAAEVRKQARRTIEELFSLADQIPAEVRERTEATLDALEVK